MDLPRAKIDELEQAANNIALLASDPNFVGIRERLVSLSFSLTRFARHGESAGSDGELAREILRLNETVLCNTDLNETVYDQPVFKCYSDYKKCLSENQHDRSQAILCALLFSLSLVNALAPFSISLKPGS